MQVKKYILSSQELKQINSIIDYAMSTFSTAEDEDFILESKLLSNRLSDDLKKYLYRSDDPTHNGLFVLSGFDFGEQLPATPKTWFKEDSYEAKFRTDYLAIILASIFGEPFGFDTQQRGKLIHDILPIKGREYFQEGANSLQMLNMHTEDTFHPYRADYICLSCLKNPCNIGTLLSGVQFFELDDKVKNILFEDRFYHLSDDTHVEDIDNPVSQPILFGDRKSPFVRFDYDFTITSKGDIEAKEALEAFNTELLKRKFELSLNVGDFCFIDNHKWLHGRKPFQANFDGEDRWLRRFNIKVDLSEASAFRMSHKGRMLSFEPTNIAQV